MQYLDECVGQVVYRYHSDLRPVSQINLNSFRFVLADKDPRCMGPDAREFYSLDRLPDAFCKQLDLTLVSEDRYL